MPRQTSPFMSGFGGLLSRLLGGSQAGGGGLLSPEIQQYMERQRGVDTRRALARGLMSIATGRPAAGGGGRGGGLLQAMQMQGLLEQRRGRQEKEERRDVRQGTFSEMVGGPDPRTGIDWQTGRQGVAGAVDPRAQGMLRAMGPEAGTEFLAKQALAKPPVRKTATDVAGHRRYLDSGKRTFPGAEKAKDPRYSGDLKFDAAVGKHYQTNPKTGKREYTSSPTGMEITTSDGTTIRTGVPRGGMQKKTRGNIEGKLLGAREGLARLHSIAERFKPEYQEIPTRLGVAWTGLKARFGAGDISPEDRRSLTDFVKYRRGAISNINLYIKEITGAQMSEAEADRLRLAVPDPGEGIYPKDDPITFKAKMDSAVEDLEKAAVRYEHYLNQGITDPEEIARRTPLDTMEIYVNPQTGEEIVEIDGQWVPLK